MSRSKLIPIPGRNPWLSDAVLKEIESLSNTDIIVARKIRLKSSLDTSSDEIKATAKQDREIGCIDALHYTLLA